MKKGQGDCHFPVYISRWFLFALMCISFALTPVHAKNKKSKKLSLEEKALGIFMLEMQTTAVSRSVKRQVEKIAKRSKNENYKFQAIGCLAVYKAAKENKYKNALLDLAPYILPSNLLKEFKKTLNKRHKGQSIEFPPSSKWSFKYPVLCVYAAKILSYTGKESQALGVFDKVASKTKGIPQIFAVEGVGDLCYSLERFEKSIESYSFCLEVLDVLSQHYQYKKKSGDTFSVLKKRIRSKLDLAQKAYDAQQYGPSFVAYKEAREAQFNDEFLKAYVLFTQLYSGDFLEYLPFTPEITEEKEKVKNGRYVSVFGEAAGLYRNLCLFKLALPLYREVAKKEIKKLEKDLKNQQSFLKKYAKNMLPDVIELYEKNISMEENLLKNFKGSNFRKNAFELAVNNLKSFISENEYGLYRGEAYLALASYYFDNKMDVANAEENLLNAGKWLKKFDNFRDAIKNFKIPFKVSTVTSSPSAPYEIDEFNNVQSAKIKPEMLINRINTPWFIDYLKTKYYRMLGFIAFVKEDKQQALESFAQMRKYDELNRINEQRGDWGDYKRLVWGAENGFFYANKAELDSFDKKFKLPVLLGDYFYVTMQFKKSSEIYRRILNKEFGSPNKRLAAYSTYMLGNEKYWENERINAFKLWKKAHRLGRGTYAGERAYFAAGQLALNYFGKLPKIINNPGNLKLNQRKIASLRKEGFEILNKLSEKAVNRDWKNQSKLALSMYYYHIKSQKNKARKMVKSIIPKNDKEKEIINTYLKYVLK